MLPWYFFARSERTVCLSTAGGIYVVVVAMAVVGLFSRAYCVDAGDFCNLVVRHVHPVPEYLQVHAFWYATRIDERLDCCFFVGLQLTQTRSARLFGAID